MLEILNFFEPAETGAEGGGGFPAWLTYVLLGVLIVGFIAYIVLSNRRQKKRAEEMMSHLTVGSTVTTIGGIVGEVVEMDDTHIWISTGTANNKTTMQFVRQAIHSVAPASGSSEAVAQAQKVNDDESDEIK